MNDMAARLRVVKEISSVVSAFTVAASFMRGMSIKRFAPLGSSPGICRS